MPPDMPPVGNQPMPLSPTPANQQVGGKDDLPTWLQYLWPEPLWAIEVPKGSDWPCIDPVDIRDYSKSPWTEQDQRYSESGLEKLRQFGLLPPQVTQ